MTTPADAPVERRFHQHVLILTVDGTGLVREAGRRRRAGPGSLTWLDTRLDYAHRCHGSATHWRYLWIGVSGFGLDLLFAQTAAAADPVTQLSDPSRIARRFMAVHAAMRSRDPMQGVCNTAEVAAIIAQILANRRRPLTETQPGGLRSIERALMQLRQALARQWSIVDLAEAAGLSVSQLHRAFQAETGMSPMAWLRQERINTAKPLLLDPSRPIHAVAEMCGYYDPFHFSRDFKMLTGRSPRAFRVSGGA